MQRILCRPRLPVVYFGHPPNRQFSLSRGDVRSNVRARFGLANHVQRSFTCDDIFGTTLPFGKYISVMSHGYQGTTLLHREISRHLPRQSFSTSISPISQPTHSIPSVVSMKTLPASSFSASLYRHFILVCIQSVR
jgi:hypothetical protein